MREKGIFGWSLPPGVSNSDLPGNTPQDQEADRAEAFTDALDAKCQELDAVCIDDRIIDWLWNQMAASYSEGYQQGVADEALANEYKKA